MEKYILFRIDNRLVHGQVCTAWIPQLSIKRVVIIHDEYAQDEMICKLHETVVPQGVVCDTITTEEAARQWKKDQFGSQPVIVIFQTPAAAKEALDAGIDFKSVQIATLGGGSEKTVSIYKQVNISAANWKILMDMIHSGVDFYCQMFPNDSKVSVENLLDDKKIKRKLKL